jgi:hypothetical protein
MERMCKKVVVAGFKEVNRLAGGAGQTHEYQY